MINFVVHSSYYILLLWTSLFAVKFNGLSANAQSSMYNPVNISTSKEITDTLSEQDIPTGEGGFARDYSVELKENDRIAIDLLSEDFDTIVMLIAEDGSTIAENDDGPDGTTNSLLFARVLETGKYIIRVQAFGETSGGKFTLKLTRLKPANK